MRVLHILRSLNPSQGGPARSVPDFCRALQAEGIDISLYTLRSDHAELSVSPENEPFEVRWFRPLPQTRHFPSLSFYHHLRQHLDTYDLVHLQGLWSPASSLTATMCRYRKIPYIISLLGNLQSQAMRFRRIKKLPYYWLWERATIEKARVLHFFTDFEAQDSRPFFKNTQKQCIIPNGIDPQIASDIKPHQFRLHYPELKNKKILLSLGRQAALVKRDGNPNSCFIKTR